MKRLLALFLILLAPLHAAEVRIDGFGCSVNLPEGDGWQAIPAPAVPGITVLVAMENPRRKANFIVNVIDNVPGTDLNDPKVQGHLGGLLKSFTYDFFGFSKVQIGGISWLQYPVTSRAGGVITKGVVRFASGNGRVFGVSLMLGGGLEPSQDVELQTVAASFRFFTPVTAQSAAVAANQPATGTMPGIRSGAESAAPSPAQDKPVAEEPEKTVLGGVPISYVRYAVIGASALLVLILLVKIIGGGSPQKK